MKTTQIRSILTLGVLGFVAAVLPAQDDKPEVKPPVGELIENLGHRDYKVRKAAETALRERGSEAADALKKAADNDGDAEVQWRARRVLQQIESGADGRLQRRSSRAQDPASPGQGTTTPWRPRWPQTGGDADLEKLFGDLFEQLERSGVDVPRGHFFRDDFFQSLQQQLEDARRGVAMGVPGRGQAFSMRMDQNGVRIEVTEQGEDGKSENKVYEAPDVKTFREQYPEIAERYLRGDGSATFGFGDLFPAARQFRLAPMPRPEAMSPPSAVTHDDGERLGVYVEEVTPEIRDFLQLEDGHGLRVQSVDPGSLGSTLGVEDGDVLLQVGSQKVGSVLDVRDGLSAVAAGDKLTVKVNRRGSEKTLETTKPVAVKPSRKLEKRDEPTDTGDQRKREIR